MYDFALIFCSGFDPSDDASLSLFVISKSGSTFTANFISQLSQCHLTIRTNDYSLLIDQDGKTVQGQISHWKQLATQSLDVVQPAQTIEATEDSASSVDSDPEMTANSAKLSLTDPSFTHFFQLWQTIHEPNDDSESEYEVTPFHQAMEMGWKLAAQHQAEQLNGVFTEEEINGKSVDDCFVFLNLFTVSLE